MTDAGRRVAIVQSNYIPWRGYFDMIALADTFVFLDDVQYTRRDWRNRNKIRTVDGAKWLSIPVKTKGGYHQLIRDTEIADPHWAADHWRALELAYARAPYFATFRDRYRSLFEHAATETHLSAVNRLLIGGIMQDLGIETTLIESADLAVDGTKSDRILNLCRAAGATRYLSGPSAAAYMDLDAFAAAGIQVEWMRYDTQKPYPQVHGEPYLGQVSILDMLFNTGDMARNLLVSADRRFAPEIAGQTKGAHP
ncbi:MAG: WbqC family protein [Alphaproteobacteria bacterium]|nr:WbqC family protein [Alphaproteobacteria bacterium]